MKAKAGEGLRFTRLDKFIRMNGMETEGMRGIDNPLYPFILFRSNIGISGTEMKSF